MRRGNMLLCDCCGKVIKTDDDMKKKADKLKHEGSRLNCSATCEECGGIMDYYNFKYGCRKCGNILEV